MKYGNEECINNFSNHNDIIYFNDILSEYTVYVDFIGGHDSHTVARNKIVGLGLGFDAEITENMIRAEAKDEPGLWQRGTY